MLAAWGAWALFHVPLDAIPDLSDVQVIVYTEWPGRSPTLIEDQITYPIVTTLLAGPQVKKVRGVSEYGVSYVYVIFEDRTDLYWARSRVLEYMQKLTSKLPAGIARGFELEWTEYVCVGGDYLKSVEDIDLIPDGTDNRGTLILLKKISSVQHAPNPRPDITELAGKVVPAGDTPTTPARETPT